MLILVCEGTALSQKEQKSGSAKASPTSILGGECEADSATPVTKTYAKRTPIGVLFDKRLDNENARKAFENYLLRLL